MASRTADRAFSELICASPPIRVAGLGVVRPGGDAPKRCQAGWLQPKKGCQRSGGARFMVMFCANLAEVPAWTTFFRSRFQAKYSHALPDTLVRAWVWRGHNELHCARCGIGKKAGLSRHHRLLNARIRHGAVNDKRQRGPLRKFERDCSNSTTFFDEYSRVEGQRPTVPSRQ